MKKLKLLLATLLTPIAMFAQEGVNYQAVVRDNGGNLIVNTAVAVDIEIIETSAGGAVVYSESHNPTTNDYGLINLVIGTGTVNSGVFADINWGGDTHFLGITIDGNNLGAVEFKTVPYAYHANSLTNVTPNTVMSDVEITSQDNFAVLGIYPTANTANDSSSIFFGEGTTQNNGMSLTYDGTLNELKVSGLLGGSSTGTHLTIERNTGDASFSQGLEIQETTTTPAKNKVYGNSGPLAYGYISGTTIATNYGITSITNPSTGLYTIVLSNSWNGNPVIVATSLNNSADTEIVTYNTTGSNTINVRIVDENNLPVVSNFSIVVYGTAL